MSVNTLTKGAIKLICVQMKIRLFILQKIKLLDGLKMERNLVVRKIVAQDERS